MIPQNKYSRFCGIKKEAGFRPASFFGDIPTRGLSLGQFLILVVSPFGIFLSLFEEYVGLFGERFLQ